MGFSIVKKIARPAFFRLTCRTNGPTKGHQQGQSSPALVHDVRQVIGWNLWPERLAPEAFRDALGRMATVWGM